MTGVATITQPDNTAQSGAAYKANIDGAILMILRLAGLFAAHQQATADMTVAIDAGTIFNPVTLARTTVAAQSSATFTAPSAEPRQDIVTIDRETGVVGVTTGSESASPSDPTVPSGTVPVARVRLTVGQTEIVNADIDDLRDLFSLGLAFGTGANDIVTLDGSGKLPAVDGSQLTNVTDAGLSSNMRLAFLKLAELDGDRLNMVAGIADPYADQTDVDTGSASGATYDAAGDYYHNHAAATEGSWSGTPATARSVGVGEYPGVRFQASVTGSLETVKVNVGTAGAGTVSCYLYSDDGASPGHPATLLATSTNTQSYGSTGEKTWTFSGASVTAGTKYWIVPGTPTGGVDLTTVSAVTGVESGRHSTITSIASSGQNVEALGEDWKCEISISWTPPDISLPSVAFTADSAPAAARIHVQVTEVDAVTINTDLLADVSRDGGTTWTTATLALAETLADGTKAYEDAAIDISGQPSGTSMKYRIRTDNGKEVRVHGVVLQWA